MTGFKIRPADPLRDRAAMLSFIDGLQAFEHKVEPNRWLDATVAADHMAVLDRKIAEHGGAIFIAEEHGRPAGWAVVHEAQDDLYIVEAERRIAIVHELYLTEATRGRGAGQALLAACEDWARGRGIRVIMIGVLARNMRAHDIYRAAGYSDLSIQLRKYLRAPHDDDEMNVL